MIRIFFTLTLTLAVSLIACKNGQANSSTSLDTDSIEIHELEKEDKSTYSKMRDQALSITPEQLELSLSADRTIAYGIIMDWGIDGGVATLVAFQTGDASLYLSSGGGMIGGGKHLSVSDASKDFLKFAQNFLDKTTKAEKTPLPGDDIVKFYFLTNKGIFSCEEKIKNFDDNSSVLLPLFEKGNEVMNELRFVCQQKK